MCGRASLSVIEKELEERFNAHFYSEDIERYNPLPTYNVAPSQLHPILSNKDPNRLQFFKWGLVPFWAKDPKIGYKMINSRIETILEKPSFKNAIQRRRCLVPIDSFYEWKKEGNIKQAYRIQFNCAEVFSLAGIWEHWKSDLGEEIYSFSLITQEANEDMKDLHHRMPAILYPEDEKLWLENEVPTKDLLKIISPLKKGELKISKVSTKVNSPRNNDVSLHEEI